MPSTPAPIAIIGGGPCGLMFARLLELAGIPYVVFERDGPDGRLLQGGSLDIHPGTGQAALAAGGLKEQFDALARHEADIFTVQDAQGEHRFRHGDLDDPEREKNEKRPEIDRHQLRELLLGSLPGERIRWGKTLKSLERGHGDLGDAGAAGWVLRFVDGSAENGFRLVVGADGAWSKVRPVIASAIPTYSGMTYFEGRLSPDNPQYAAAQELSGPGSSASCGDGRAIVIQQLSDRSYRVYAGLKDDVSVARPGGKLDFATTPQDRTAECKAELLNRFADFAPHVRAFVEAAEGPWRVWPLYYLDAAIFGEAADEEQEQKKMWTRAPGVTLLGDAAHLALPNGEGVNIAMFDALRLFECLSAELAACNKQEGGEEAFDAAADAAAVERAIVAYETEMRKRAAEHVVDGIWMTNMMFKGDGAQQMAAFFKQFGDGPGQQQGGQQQ